MLNPQDFNIKRRWDDDVIFKNQARGTENKGDKEFVNVSLIVYLFILNIAFGCMGLAWLISCLSLGFTTVRFPQAIHGLFTFPLPFSNHIGH